MRTTSMRAGVAGVALVLAGAGATATATAAAGPSFEERVAAQRAIEQVYWSHRIWPEHNPGPKPDLDTVLPEEALRTRVRRSLQLSAALEAEWGREITAERLQAEVRRMVARTRSPRMLRELFRALGDDPLLVAETLARSILVERWAAEAYAYDANLHAATRQAAEAAVAAGLPAGSGAEEQEVRWAWSEAGIEDRIARAGSLIEHADRFEAYTLLSRNGEEIVARVASWPKQPFDTWWDGQHHRFGYEISAGEPAGGYVLPRVIDAACSVESWAPTLADRPARRFFHATVWTGAEMIVWGGHNGWAPEDTGARYDPATDTWAPMTLSAATPSKRHRASAVWTGTEMLVWGGWTGQAATSSGARYNPASDTWTEMSTGTGTPAARERATAVWTGTEMIVWGGYDSSTNTHFNTGGRYNPGTDSWTATSTGAGVPTARRDHTAVWTNNVMVVWGGYNGTAAVNTGSRYNPSTNTWTATAAGPAARHTHSAVWTGSVMIVWGGYNGTTALNTGSRYNPTTNTWAATSTAAGVPPGAFEHTAVWTGSVMIVWGGNNGSASVAGGGRYNPTTNAWAAISSTGSPLARQAHGAVWTSSEMIVWGGYYGDVLHAHDTGARYDPVADTWVATAFGTTPEARTQHTAIWTGSEMIVWGGENVFPAALSTGGRYDPATDSWTTVPSAGAPSARTHHSAVWTGTQMIVWGGAPGAPWVDTGGRFDPTTSTWTPMAVPTGVVSARSDHTAVWTGTEMIVWGGAANLSSPFYTNTGGRYAPSSDTWTATSTGPDVATPRTFHRAVWTGAEMIVWGGYDGSAPLASGGRYSPAANGWLPLATAGAPAARYAHSAVWTGTRMIVWGGNPDTGSGLASGGSYDPQGDAWQATPSTGAPAGRFDHTAVWTGSEMIVWGGIEGAGLLGSGGRYSPAGDTWTPTPSEDAPEWRRYHSAVWTGTQMIVWGGTGSEVFGAVNHGGLYDVGTDGQACDDGNPCTGADTCSGLTCQGQPLVVPSEVTGLAWGADGETLSWNPAAAAGPGTVHDLLRGEVLPVGSGTESCIAPGTAGAQATEASVPAPGAAFWYLVRGRNTCGSGTYGQASSGDPRLSSACP